MHRWDSGEKHIHNFRAGRGRRCRKWSLPCCLKAQPWLDPAAWAQADCIHPRDVFSRSSHVLYGHKAEDQPRSSGKNPPHICGKPNMTGCDRITGNTKNKWFLPSQTTCPTWSVPCTPSSNWPLWLTVSDDAVPHDHQQKLFPGRLDFSWVGPWRWFSFLPPPGCKVDQYDLKVEAVNTHRDRPLVRVSTLL